jgi:hypothetical protein
MKLTRLVLGLSVAALVAVLPETAGATVIASDDAMFSLDVGSGRVCFVEPPSLRSADDCVGLDLSAYPTPPVSDPLARLAYGLVRGPGEGAARPVVGAVTMMRAPSHATSAPTQASAVPISEEVSEALAATWPAAPPHRVARSTLLWGKNVPVVRTTLEATVLDAGGDAGTGSEASGPREVLTAVGGRYLYITVWSGAVEHAAELARLAEGAATTTDLKPEARPVTKLNPWPGRLLFFFGALGLLLLRFRQKKRAPAPRPPAS